MGANRRLYPLHDLVRLGVDHGEHGTGAVIGRRRVVMTDIVVGPAFIRSAGTGNGCDDAALLDVEHRHLAGLLIPDVAGIAGEEDERALSERLAMRRAIVDR